MRVATFAWLLALWLAFSGSVAPWELVIGAGAAALALTAHELVRRQRLAPFRPSLHALALSVRLSWDVIRATAIMLTLPPTHWLSAPFVSPGDAAGRGAQQALAVTYINVSPTTIVLALDPVAGRLYLHQMGSPSVPPAARRLGAGGSTSE